MNNATPYDLSERTLNFGIRAVSLYRYLAKKQEHDGIIVGRQFLRSATSIGANVAEAMAGETRRDFVHKYSLAQKEARESKYWLRLMIATEMVSLAKVAYLIKEIDELLAIITSIIVKAKKGLMKE